MDPIDVGLESWVSNLAARLQLDSPASARPPLVTAGAPRSSADTALGPPSLQSAAPLQSGLGRGLQQAGLHGEVEQAAPAGLQRAGSLSALRLPGMPSQRQELAHGLSPEPSDHASLPSDIDGLAHDSSPFGPGAEMDLGELEADLDELEGRNAVKRAWTPEEDASLLQLVQDLGPRSWSVISKQLPGRVGKQCRERYAFPRVRNSPARPPPTSAPHLSPYPHTHTRARPRLPLATFRRARAWHRWHNHVCPSVNKEEWTDAEDQLIMELVQKLGTKWSKIAQMLPGRTDNAIKNRSVGLPSRAQP